MTSNKTNAASHRIFAAVFALLIALSLSVPAHAVDELLNPDGFNSRASATVASTPDYKPVTVAEEDESGS